MALIGAAFPSILSAAPPTAGQLKAAGIRKIESAHLVLYTDVASSDAVDSLPKWFDAAVPQWCDYFGVERNRAADWRLTACIMRDDNPFAAVGLLPNDLPPFLHGYARGRDLWCHEQASDYYRRHLLLHEGTHAFMNEFVGLGGRPWYLEGMAELLATHAIDDAGLNLLHFPADRESVPLWGRIKLVRDAADAGRPLSFPAVLDYGPRAHLETAAYGWSWAAAAFLDGHPRCRERFRGLPKSIDEPDFNAAVLREFAGDWDELCDEFDVFVAELEYGHDLVRSAIEFLPGEPLAADGSKTEIRADRGWQSSGIHLESGRTYRITASGRYQLAAAPKIWWSEANGVSIRYHRGRPLGMLLAAVRPDARTDLDRSPLAAPQPIGLAAEIAPETDGTLYLKINDSPAELADNEGTLEIAVEAMP